MPSMRRILILILRMAPDGRMSVSLFVLCAPLLLNPESPYNLRLRRLGRPRGKSKGRCKGKAGLWLEV